MVVNNALLDYVFLKVQWVLATKWASHQVRLRLLWVNDDLGAHLGISRKRATPQPSTQKNGTLSSPHPSFSPVHSTLAHFNPTASFTTASNAGETHHASKVLMIPLHFSGRGAPVVAAPCSCQSGDGPDLFGYDGCSSSTSHLVTAPLRICCQRRKAPPAGALSGCSRGSLLKPTRLPAVHLGLNRLGGLIVQSSATTAGVTTISLLFRSLWMTLRLPQWSLVHHH